MHAEHLHPGRPDVDVTDLNRPMTYQRPRLRRSSSPPAPAGPTLDPDPSIELRPFIAFDDFYRAHRDIVARMLALTLGDDGLGYEAADEAMSRAYERWSSVAGYANPEGWVYRAGLNWARSWLRRRKVGATKDALAAVVAATQIVDQSNDTDVALAIARLPRNHRAVVVLRYYRDWSVEQTAEALDIAPGMVKSRLSRALQKLEMELTDTRQEGDIR